MVGRVQGASVVICSASPAVKLTTALVSDPLHAPAFDERQAPMAAEVVAAPAEQMPPSGETQKPPESGIIDLVIEELPNHRLYHPIPVHMQPFGTEMFSASVPGLTLSVTGTSVSDALLLLKAQIEAGYTEIEKKTDLDASEKEQLKFYYAHIVKNPPAPEFASVRAHGSAHASKSTSRWAGRW